VVDGDAAAEHAAELADLRQVPILLPQPRQRPAESLACRGQAGKSVNGGALGRSDTGELTRNRVAAI
jgi:hypothetical protein